MLAGPSLPLDPKVIPAFLLAMAVVELTPGPNMAYLAVVSASRGRLAGFAVVGGVTFGLATYLLLSIATLSAAAAFDPRVLQVLRAAGVAYMLWLAFDTFRSRGGEAQEPHLLLGRPDWRDTGRFAARGFLANVLNAKAAVFYLALMPGFIREGFGTPAAQASVLGIAHLAISVAVHSVIVVSSSQLSALIGGADRRVTRAFFSAMLVAVAAWLAFSGWV